MAASGKALQAYNLHEDLRVEEVAVSALPEDKGTPDEWVARCSELIRLTGRHPLNCEPPLRTLMQRCWPLTPAALLYVRSHGRVPRVDAAAHCLVLRVPGGAAPRELRFSMAQLRAMPQRRVAATLVCAGNRRKEVAMVHPVSGFNWGAAALGTCVWTGTPLCELLRAAGVHAPAPEAQHVCFTGAPGEVPVGDCYGTSIPLAHALDPAADVLLAWEHNGAPLSPDHGAPLRVVVPGFIGGRSVKWLAGIEVTQEPSRNHYHTHDNRILPPDVTQERADAEGWWHREEYVFNELNVNSVLASPAHDERIALPPPGSGPPQPLELHGYAYSGGGRPITRVEMSFDGGATWHLAALSTWERGTPSGRHWCAVAWSFALADARELLLADEVACRAWDAASNTQPAELTWNLKGMGNNCWYRVRVHKERGADGGVVLRFEAPVEPDGLRGGWMGAVPGGFNKQVPAVPPSLVLEQPGTPRQDAEKRTTGGAVGRKGSARRIEMSELQQHNKETDCWIAIAGKVYDPTRFLKEHPGGSFPIVSNAGKDATEEFSTIHSQHAWAMLDEYVIGELAGGGATPPQQAQQQPDDTTPWVTVPPGEERAPHVRFDSALVALHPRKRLPFRLTERIVVNHDTRIFRFALPSPEHVLGLPAGRHVFVSANIANHRVVRPYTPITPCDTRGFFDLLIKVYFPQEGRPGGLMSTFLDGLRPGAEVHVRGPLGHIEYAGRGAFYVNDERVSAADVGFIAGGSGITPIWQVLQAACADPQDATRLSLVYCNKTVGDILLRAELDALARAHAGRVRVWHVVDRLDDEAASGDDAHAAASSSSRAWPYSTGLVSADILRAHLPPPAAPGGGGAAPLILLCGPPGLERAARTLLAGLGHTPQHVADF